MDSVTKLIATLEEAELLANRLIEAVESVRETGDPTSTDIILEQLDNEGPWRLVIGVALPAELEERTNFS